MECRNIITSKMLRPPPRRVLRRNPSPSPCPCPRPISIGETRCGTKRKQMDEGPSKPKSLSITTPIAPIPTAVPIQRSNPIPKPGMPKSVSQPSKTVSQPNKTVSEPNKNDPNPKSSNMVVAGCMANEFLTRGTLMGRQCGESSNTHKDTQKETLKETQKETPKSKNKRYIEVSVLLKTDEAHIPDIFNPTELFQFLKL